MDNKSELGLNMSPSANGKSFIEPCMEKIGENVKFESSQIIDLGSIERETQIKKIAWQVFLSTTGMRFIRELTPEEKNGVLGVDSYYMEQATKVYEKKQKSVHNKKYPVIEVPADGKSGMSGGAYCLCFVYSKYNSNFVLKGYMREVKEYLKKNYTHYFCNYSMWNGGLGRNSWYFWKENIGIFDVSVKERKKGKKTQVRPWSNMEIDEETMKEKTFYFKRLPKRWIPEFDNL